MKILVCIKQVPESELTPDTDEKKQWVTYSPHLKYKFNRFDEYALEEALSIQENLNEVSVNVITIGAERASEVIKRAFGMGAGKGIHVITAENEYNDPYNTALLIAKEAQRENYDLILTGIMSEDMMQAQTGQMVAEILDLPCSTGIISLNTEPDSGVAFAEREIEGGLREKIEIKLPALLTIQAGINTPRYPTLSKILKANTKEIISVYAKRNDKRQTAVSVGLPVKSRSGVLLTGSTDDKAKQLYSILKDKNAIVKAG